MPALAGRPRSGARAQWPPPPPRAGRKRKRPAAGSRLLARAASAGPPPPSLPGAWTSADAGGSGAGPRGRRAAGAASPGAGLPGRRGPSGNVFVFGSRLPRREGGRAGPRLRHRLLRNRLLFRLGAGGARAKFAPAPRLTVKALHGQVGGYFCLFVCFLPVDYLTVLSVFNVCTFLLPTLFSRIFKFNG